MPRVQAAGDVPIDVETLREGDLSGLDLVAIQIDGLHLDEHLLMIGAVGIAVSGHKHPLGMLPTCWNRTSLPKGPMRNGSLTYPTSPPSGAGFIWLS